MHSITPQTAGYGTETRDLERLLEVFGSVFTLKDISSAYREAKHNIDVASDILCSSRGSTSSSDSYQSKDKCEGADAISSGDRPSQPERTTALRSRPPSDNVLQKPCNGGGGGSRASKSKATSVSMGTVSSVIGKEYVRPRSSVHGSKDVTKPMKLDSNEFPMSQIWNEEVQSGTTEKNSKMHADDVEEFLFRMLGDGFQLDKDVTREVLSESYASCLLF